LYYEILKHTGEFPIIGVNTFLSSKGSPTVIPAEVIRATEEEKQYQIDMLNNLHKRNSDKVEEQLNVIQEAVKQNKECEISFKKLKDAIKNETIKKDNFENMTNELLEKNILSNEEIEKMKKAHALKQEVISVDSFEANEYKEKR
jgi:methylmalonyl-CoA mutase N-terminal domain/subunit